MHVVTVLFEIKIDRLAAFMDAIVRQARNSLDREPNCHQFDICVDPKQPHRVFLYEVYSSQADFADHLESDHFKHFDSQVADWVETKTVHQFDRIAYA
jgi:quinol monooxygenase YgiN